MHPVVTYQRPPVMSRIPVPVPRPPEDGNTQKAKPSRLQAIQAHYQQQILKEKEQKLIHMYEENHRRAIEKAARKLSGKGVRGFFNDRRDMERQGVAPPINQHYQQTRRNKSAGSYGKETYVKNSAGKDRSNPLQPIDKQSYQENKPKNRPQESDPKPPPPFVGKPKLARPHRRNSQKNLLSDRENSDMTTNGDLHLDLYRNDHPDNGSATSSVRPESNKLKPIGQKQQPENHIVQEPEVEKLTEFQKWQLEQNKAREERLNRFQKQVQQFHTQTNNGTVEYIDSESDENTPQHNVNHQPARVTLQNDINLQPDRVPTRKDQKKNKIKQKALSRIRYLSESENEVEPETDFVDNLNDEELRIKEQQLSEMIRQQKEELEMMRRQREREEEEERKAYELQQRRDEDQRERLRWLEEAQRRDREIEEEEKIQKETYQLTHKTQRILHENDHYHNRPSPPHTPPSKPTRAIRNIAKTRKHKPPVAYKSPKPEEEERAPSVGHYQQEHVVGEDYVQLNLVMCQVCGRKFADDRLAKHMKICRVTSNKKRKVMDPVKTRTQGTEHEKYVANPARQPEPKPKKSHWKENHKNFIQAIRYAKKVTEIEAQGGKVSDLPPPPVTENPDYVKCQWCSRTFAPATAERHIPRCKDIKSRPAPPKKRR